MKSSHQIKSKKFEWYYICPAHLSKKIYLTWLWFWRNWKYCFRWRSGSKTDGWNRKNEWRRVWSRPSHSPVLRAAAAVRPTWAGLWGLTRALPQPPSPPPRKVPLTRSCSLSCLLVSLAEMKVWPEIDARSPSAPLSSIIYTQIMHLSWITEDDTVVLNIHKHI